MIARATDAVWSELEHFTPAEFSEPAQMAAALLFRLELAREIAGVPFVLNSTHRPGDPRAHGRGNAVDIDVETSSQRFHVVRGLILAGFRRLGIYDEHVHGDVDAESPQDVMWWAKSL